MAALNNNNNNKNRLASKLRHLTKKVLTALVFKRNKPAQTASQAEPVKPELNILPTEVPLWMQHPSDVCGSPYIAVHHSEMDENAANEALEAKLRQLIVTEYTQRSLALQQPLSIRIEGQLTIVPSTMSSNLDPTMAHATFWTADADLCWRDQPLSSSSSSCCSYSSGHQRAERQTPVSY